MSGRNERDRITSLGAILALAATLGAVLATAANAGPPIKETIHEERTDILLQDFCDVAGLDVTLGFVMDIRVHINPHAPDGLEYFLQHGTRRELLTANGTSLTSFSRVTEKDLRVTAIGGGDVEVVILATGNAVLYDENGKAIARNPGQTRFVIVFDEAGNELSREVVKGSTGRTDDFCGAAVPALT